MPNAIGTAEINLDSFSAQLAAAGLNKLPFSYNEAGQFSYAPSMTQEQIAQVQGIYAKHNPTTGHLVQYANDKQWTLATGGFTITIDGVPRTFATDAQSQSLIDSTSNNLRLSGAPASVNWQFDVHVIVPVQAPDFLHASELIAGFRQATFDTLQTVFSGIQAGTIATEFDVDNAPWPEPFG